MENKQKRPKASSNGPSFNCSDCGKCGRLMETYVSNFKVGKTYLTNSGKSIRIIREANENTEYWSVLGDDSERGWRYADNGFLTGTALGAACPSNLIIGNEQNG